VGFISFAYGKADQVVIQYFSPKWAKGFHAPFEAFHLVTKQALDWAANKFHHNHPDIPHDHHAIAEYVYGKNEKTWDEMFDSGELSQLIKESYATRVRCLGEAGELPNMDLKLFLSDKRQEQQEHPVAA